jgi:VanZ family protein
MPRRRSDTNASRLLASFWLPVLVYVAAIFVVSAQSRLQPPLTFNQSDKFYHFLEYGLLGLLLARAFRATMRDLSPLVVALVAVSCGIVVGTSDEYFQSFIPGRDSNALDLAFDTVGLALAQVGFRLLVRD